MRLRNWGRLGEKVEKKKVRERERRRLQDELARDGGKQPGLSVGRPWLALWPRSSLSVWRMQ